MDFLGLGQFEGMSIEQIIRLILTQTLFGTLSAAFSIVGELATIFLDPLSLFTNSFPY
ncbi:MAG: hypothetical protein O7D94_08300 [Planctomycetota bacterium]|nr:hypothetical protein [Planctomycetota bacterium]